MRTIGEFKSLAEIENLPIFTPKGTLIHLRDVAQVVETYKKTTSFTIINGKRGIKLGVTKQSSANAVAVAKRVVKEAEAIQADYPQLKISIITDSSHFIQSTIKNVWSTILLAVALAFVVLVVALRNVKTSVIISVAIPISIVATLGLMFFFGMTLNVISLTALLISVGMLVDNSVVVLESITRYIDSGYDVNEAAELGSNEVRLSVFASTLTTVIVFVPVLFVTGIAGVMFGQIGFVIIFSLVSSLAVSLSFVPMACSKWMKKKPGGTAQPVAAKRGGLWSGFVNVYEKILRVSLKNKKKVLVLFFAALVGSFYGASSMGMQTVPEFDQGYFVITVKTPVGSRISETSDATDVVLERIKGDGDIDEVLVTVGGANINEAQILVKLIPMKDRSDIYTEMERFRVGIGSVAGAEVNVAILPTASNGSSSSRIDMSIYGRDNDILGEISGEITERISGIAHLRNVTGSFQEGYPQARVTVDRNKAANYGLSASTVASNVNMAINGRTVTKYKIDGDEIDIVLRYNPERLHFITDLENLTISSAAGTIIPLSQIASITTEQGPATITKENYKQYVSISADIENSDSRTVQREILAALADYELPNGYHYEFSGASASMIKSFMSLGMALMLGIVLVYMVIASQFESLLLPGIILFSIPFAFGAGLFGLFATGNSLGMTDMIGLILLMGIVVNNGIMLIDYTNIKISEGLPVLEAVVTACTVRIKPIFMTSVTTVLGILPMIFATGDGSEIQRPLGLVLSFGLTFSTLITLILIPILFMLMNRNAKNV